ncbi:complex I NDUFA9 subunit family protein [Hyphococcus flavus]|uniref:Complex I NDUFA9 subunit family protein n=1 Tax=Hyphococcus flavus TaxID=1866326 RepID=A0AAF0CEM7_9PROT|nr:complex I NDUFA9 subunit family protein [Hyphococcus flavus]WDI30449.1 complex I NDUFA9 subunit family protein [Hyphococcus flavus]
MATGKLAVVFGGSGFVGRYVVRELAKRGWRVRVAVRRPHLAQFLRPMGSVGQIQLKQCNVRHRPSVADALHDADAVINLVGLLHQTGAQTFNAVQSAGAVAIAALAKEAGAETFVHISAIGADAESDSLYARTKGEAELAVKNAFPEAVIMRPSIVFGQEDSFFNKFANLARLVPALPLIGGGKTRFQPVYVDDVADAVCEALVRPDAKGRIFELGGPRIYTFRELMELMLRETGQKRLLAPVPFPVASLIGFFAQIVGRLPFLEPVLTADQVKLLKKDNLVDDSGAVGVLGDLGIDAQTVESVLPAYMVRYRKYGQFTKQAA